VVEGSYVEVASVADGGNLLVHRESTVKDHIETLVLVLIIRNFTVFNSRDLPPFKNAEIVHMYDAM